MTIMLVPQTLVPLESVGTPLIMWLKPTAHELYPRPEAGHPCLQLRALGSRTHLHPLVSRDVIL